MSTAHEQHYTPKQVGEKWELSEDTIREIFRDDPGVLKVVRPETRFKRGYVSLRIPESVMIKRHAELRQRKP